MTPTRVRVLLDTNVLSETTRPQPAPSVLAYLERLRPEQTFVSTLSIAELTRGMELLNARQPERAARLRLWLHDIVVPNFADRLLPFDLNCAQEWGRLTSSEDARRRPPALLDSLIAATAAHHRLTLVTRNTRDFQQFPISVYDPWETAPNR